MTDTRVIYCLIALLLWSCGEDDGTISLDNTGYVRFFLVTDADNNVLEYPQVNTRFQAVDRYEKDNIKLLKIPVSLSDPTIENTVTVTFSHQIKGDVDLTITPESTLNFSKGNVVDTIYVQVNGRWNLSDSPQLILALESVSDPSIQIGIPNQTSPNHTLTIDFIDPALQYSFNTNKIEIIGEIGEEITFDVLFPQTYFPEDINDAEIFSFDNGFYYTLSRVAESETSITYKATIEEDLQNDFLIFQSKINLIESNGYKPLGNITLLLEKPIVVERDLSANPAAYFYDLNDQFYRTYGENWGDFNEDGTCDWQSFFAFSFPVVVEANNENGVLYDDGGTEDPDDDIYHHAFKIGFDSRVNPDLTTNSFNLKRWFTGEANGVDISPGFNIDPALEFFPADGISSTSGTVLVESQIITIGTSSGDSYNIAIAGEGTYQEIEPDLFEVKLILNATNDELFGGTISSEYLLYNNPVYPEPNPLSNTDCITPIDL
ncbi:MAG: hypothetical protein AAF149_22480 [Bacteroidota bacterium]